MTGSRTDPQSSCKKSGTGTRAAFASIDANPAGSHKHGCHSMKFTDVKFDS